MTKRMLIDATHAEETRVVVLDGSRLEDFDVETSTKRQLKGNIYLAKVVRVEPSLQAAFVEYGGNRHGFLAFGEIHPDYYQIPVADRQRLLAMEAEDARREEEEEDRAALREPAAMADTPAADVGQDAAFAADDGAPASEPAMPEAAELERSRTVDSALTLADLESSDVASSDQDAPGRAQPARIVPETIGGALDQLETLDHVRVSGAAATPIFAAVDQPTEAPVPALAEPAVIELPAAEPQSSDTSDTDLVVADRAEASHEVVGFDMAGDATADGEDAEADDEEMVDAAPPETVGGDADTGEEARERRPPPRFLRNYKIQEVIRRRQILLIQVVKEERGTKGAALTTYISLAGRYCVLMPNSPRGGGISRKITSATDRRRLKEVTAELDIPNGMGLIVRTAGANRPKPEIKRDCEYLMRLWDDIREHTMKSVAPALIYEEASLIKRSIRDVYSRDIDEILVDGEDGWKSARDFMRMLMPSHVKKVQLWRESQPLFARQQVEAQLDAMLSPTVQLRSGGYLVINQTEALVAIDVNSGRSTRERGIEETAVRTNLEAVDEVARQLRLRDLAGLIVIDLIDMESRKNNSAVERRLKEALKNDRARIQVGHISHFGLMEMSRQRLRPSLAETSFVTCPHCGGTGHVRGTESAALHVLRDIEDEGAKRRSAEIVVRVATPIAMYILNHKRVRLGEIEARYAMHVAFAGDDTLIPPQVRIDRVRALVPSDLPAAVTQDARAEPEPLAESAASVADDVPDEDEVGTEAEGGQDDVAAGAVAEGGAEAEAERRRRRRRRRRGGRREEGAPASEPSTGTAVPPAEADGGNAGLVPADLEPHVEGVPEYADAVPDAGVLDTGGGEVGTGGVGNLGAEAGDDAARGRRRGRRGGRRRRPGADGALESVAAPGAEQPELPPLYTGPTPANPFGGQAYDIFDAIEQAEQAVERPSAGRSSIPVAEPIPDWAPEPVPQAVVETPPEPAVAFAMEPVSAEAPPLFVATQAPAPEPVPEPVINAPTVLEPANDATPEPLVKPIIIGAEEDALVVEKKRGWWRR